MMSSEESIKTKVASGFSLRTHRLNRTNEAVCSDLQDCTNQIESNKSILSWFQLQNRSSNEKRHTMSNSSNLFRRLGLCENISRALSIFSQNPGLFISLGAVLVVPLTFLLAFSIDEMAKILAELKVDEDFDVNTWMIEHVNSFFAFWFALVIVGVVFGLVTEAAITRATTMFYAGESRPSWTECVKEGVRKLCSIFCFKLCLQLFLFLFSLVMGIVSGIFTLVAVSILGENAGVGIQVMSQIAILAITYYIMVALIAVVPAIVVEQKTWYNGAVDRSLELTSQKRCFLFCAVFVYSTVLTLLMMVYFGVMFLILGSSSIVSVMGVVGYGLMILFTVPITHIFNTVLYIHLRIEKEACNEQVLARDLNTAAYDGILLDSDEANTASYKDVNSDTEAALSIAKEDIV